MSLTDDPQPVVAALAAAAARSLQDIDGQDWGDPDPEESYLVRTCTALHRKPLGRFTDEDARIMIGQQIGLDALVPLAIGMLGQRPLAGGDMYPGALLGAVLGVPGSYWASYPEQRTALAAIVARVDPSELEVDEVAAAVTAFRAG